CHAPPNPAKGTTPMKLSRLVPGLLALFLLPAGLAAAHPFRISPDLLGPPSNKLPMCGLPPAKLVPNLCLLKYRITTTSQECQAFFDQGLGYFYSYVWMEAARSFEAECQCDPECGMAWWGLSRALEHYGGSGSTNALKKAQELMDRTS